MIWGCVDPRDFARSKDMQEFFCGDVIRIQLAPDSETHRYQYSTRNACWFDLGYGGPWVDAHVLDVYTGDHIMLIEYIVPDTGEVKEYMFPLPGHPTFNPRLAQMEGWPRPPRCRVPMPPCDCGCESANDGGTHYSWCSKKEWIDRHRPE